MRFAVEGHPIHTRALSVTFRHRADGRLDAEGYLLDLRKRGVVPVAADLQGPGIVHHMQLAAIIDPATRRIDEIVARQPNVAFEASDVTAGESCRDPVSRIEALRETPLDADYARRLSAAIGGPRGCSHVLTLAQLLGATAHRALSTATPGERRSGERIFRRDVILDGHEPGERRFDIAIQLTEMQYAPAAGIAQPMSRFGAQLEMRALVQIDLATLSLGAAEMSERRRGFGEIADAEWRDRSDVAGRLVGDPAMHGSSAILLARLAEAPADDAPLYDALLMMPPTMIQCFATLSDAWLLSARDADTFIGMGGIVDSCYMWRRGGALDKVRRPGDPMPNLRSS